jgi:Mrp family chromosome partitioning ATPase
VEGSAAAKSIIRQTATPNLHLIAAGNKSGNPVALLLHPATASLFEELSTAYDYVVIDTPAIDTATDAFALSKYADTTLFVVRHGLTTKNSLRKFDDSPVRNSFSVPFVIFNGIRPRGFIWRQFGYGYGYGFEKFRKSRYRKKR